MSYYRDFDLHTMWLFQVCLLIHWALRRLAGLERPSLLLALALVVLMGWHLPPIPDLGELTESQAFTILFPQPIISNSRSALLSIGTWLTFLRSFF